MSSNFTTDFSANDAALVLIDFQPQMFMDVESHDRNARYSTCTRNDGRSRCLRSGLLTVVFGMTILVYQIREMHPRLTDYARTLPNLTQYIGNLLTDFFPDLDRAF